MFKNVASQKVAVYAWDNAAGSAKTGDAANITGQISIDGGACAATDDTNPTELDATDAPGIYLFDMTQAETNGDLIIIQAASSTSDIEFRPVIIYTNPMTTTKAGYVDAPISTVDTVVDGIQTDLSNGTDGLGALKTLIDDVPTTAEFEARSIVSADYVVVGDTIAGVTLVDTVTTNSDLVTAAAVVNEWESQSQADPTGFHVNVMEVNGTGQTANDNGADINTLITQVGTDGDGLTAIPWNSAWDTEVESEVTDSLVAHNLDHLCLTATGAADMTSELADNTILSRIIANGDTSAFVPSTDSLQNIRDEVVTIDTVVDGIPTTAEFEARTLVSADYVVVGDTIAGVTLCGTTTTNSDMRGTDGANTTVPDVAGTAATLHGVTNGKIDVVDANVDQIETVVITNAAGVDIAADIIALKAETVNILADTNELQTDWADGGRLDLIQDAILDDTDLIDDGTSGLAKIATDVAAVLVDTNELQTDDIPTLIGGLNDITVANILAGVVEGAYDIQDCLKLILAFVAGKTSGGNTTTVTFRDTGDATDRIIMTVDSDGDRSAVTLDAT